MVKGAPGSGTSSQRLNLTIEKLILSIGGGVVLAVPFVFPGLSWIHFMALLPWVILFAHSRFRAHPLYVLPGSYLFLLLSLRPFHAFHFGLPLVLASFHFAANLLFPLLLRRLYDQRRLPLALLVPLAWVLTEWLRVRLWSEQLAMYFLGSSQFQWARLIQVADVAGIYGVSFLLAATSGLAADLTLSRMAASRGHWQAPARSLGIVLLLFVAALLYGDHRLAEGTLREGPRIAIIQPNATHYFDPAKTRELVDKQIEFTRNEIPPGASDLIAWPENAVDDLLNQRPDYLARLSELARHQRSYLLVGAHTGLRGRYHTSAYMFSPDGSLLDRYDKIHLILWSEYMPMEHLLSRWPRLQQLHYRLVNALLGYAGTGTPGEALKVFQLPGQRGVARFTVPICFETSSVAFGTGSARAGADFLINISSEGLLGPAMYIHMWALSTFRAVENRMGVVRVANNGGSGFIDPNGRMQSVVRGKKNGAPFLEEGTLIDRVTLDNRRGTTFYSRFGDVFVLGCALVAAALLSNALIRKFQAERAGRAIAPLRGSAERHPGVSK